PTPDAPRELWRQALALPHVPVLLDVPAVRLRVARRDDMDPVGEISELELLDARRDGALGAEQDRARDLLVDDLPTGPQDLGLISLGEDHPPRRLLGAHHDPPQHLVRPART